MPKLFEPENAELLVAVSERSIRVIDRLMGACPPDEMFAAGDLCAMSRLISASLAIGLRHLNEANGQLVVEDAAPA